MMAGRQRKKFGQVQPQAHTQDLCAHDSKCEALCQARSQWEHPDPIPDGDKLGLSQAPTAWPLNSTGSVFRMAEPVFWAEIGCL